MCGRLDTSGVDDGAKQQHLCTVMKVCATCPVRRHIQRWVLAFELDESSAFEEERPSLASTKFGSKLE